MEEEKYIKISRRNATIGLLIFNIYPLYLSIVALFRVPKYKFVYEEFLEDSLYPPITDLVLISYQWLWIFPVVFIVLSLSLLFRKEIPSIGRITMFAVAIFIMSLILQAFLLEGLIAPLIDILDRFKDAP